jgi:pilus assembly protein CpaC
MMIAGLLQERSRQSLDALPGLMNLPVIGSLLRSRDFQNGESELVIIVTPYLVKPTNANEQQTPIDGLRIANDMDTVLMGKLNRTNGVKPGAVQGRTYQGPYGYVIE